MTEQSMPLRSDPSDDGDSSRQEGGLSEAGAGISSTGPVGDEYAPGHGDAVGDGVNQELAGDDEVNA